MILLRVIFQLDIFGHDILFGSTRCDNHSTDTTSEMCRRGARWTTQVEIPNCRNIRNALGYLHGTLYLGGLWIH